MDESFGIHMKGGVITEADADYCTVRIRLPAGILSSEQMRGIATLAKRYGNGFVHCTARQAVEIPHVRPVHLQVLARELEKNRTPIGSEKDEIVNIVACPGTERCKYANVNTVRLAQKIDERLFGRDMPVKIRISISGCPNACTSPMLNEIGIIGRTRPLRVEGKCTGCGSCAEHCKERAITIKNGISILDESRCCQCGVCIRSCQFGLLKAGDLHYLIVIGGRRGRHPRVGRELTEVENEEEVLNVIETVVNWVYRHAWSGRLLSDQIDEIRFDAFREEIQKDIGMQTMLHTK